MNVLIFWPKNRLSNSGGPTGYLYQLEKGLDLIKGQKDCYVSFMPPTTKARIKRFFPRCIDNIYTNYKMIKSLDGKNRLPENINDFDVIHFHSTDDLYSVRNDLERFTGKVVLTSHSPCATFLEKNDILDPLILDRFPKLIHRFEEADRFAFLRADAVIFPCCEAEEPYFHTWKSYKEIRKECNIKYLLTGIEPRSSRISSEDIRKQLHIPNDAIIFVYVGRHNQIKGYDRLVSLGRKMLQENENIWFVVAGAKGGIKPPRHPRWIEVGWTDDPFSLISASDAFILPNRETFFDLVLLEVLSLEIPVILSKTGGNKHFEKYDCHGLMFFNNDEDLELKVTQFIEMSSTDRKKLGKANGELFSDKFTSDIFARSYCSLMKVINDERM